MPLYHCFGMVLGVLACMTHRRGDGLPGRQLRRRAKRCVPCRSERCTALHGVPTMFIAQLDHPRFAALRPNVASHRDHGGRALSGRGDAARASREMHMTRGDDRLRHDRDQPGHRFSRARTIRSSGASPPSAAIQPHCEVKIVDTERPHRPASARRASCARAAISVMHRLLGRSRADARRPIDAAGWMHSGDLATIDADGYCNIVGRVKDMVIRGGENVFPREIEEFLYRHPKVLGGAGIRRARCEARRGGAARGSCSSRVPARPRRRSASSAAARSPTTRFRATCGCVDELPEDRDRQGAEVRHARSDDARTWREARAHQHDRHAAGCSAAVGRGSRLAPLWAPDKRRVPGRYRLRRWQFRMSTCTQYRCRRTSSDGTFDCVHYARYRCTGRC